jgi:putative transposase
MARFFHPLIMVLARATESELARYVEYLKAENRILRSKLPKQVVCTPAERQRLMKLGKPLGPAIKDLITIVTPRSFARWVSGAGATKPEKKTTRKPGRPRTPEAIRELIIQMARDNGWGLGRILGELKKLGIRSVCKTTIRNILKEYGFDPGPKRGEGTWDDFIRIHAKTLWACDFISKKVWTLGGLVDFFVLFFIHVDTRKVHIAGITTNPDGRWMAQQARNMCMFFDEWPDRPKYIVCDKDTKFTEQFEAILESDDIELKRTAVRAPNQNAYAERFAQTIQQECLDHFVVLGEKHLRHIIQEFVAYYNEQRPHSSRGYLPLSMDRPPDSVVCLGPGDVVCHERLGGLLRHYERKAA